MKDLKDYVTEALLNEAQLNEAEDEVNNEKEFKEWARAKFEEVFGDELDEKKMKDTIKGFLEDNKDLVEKGEWAELVGMMNASFGK